MSKRKHRSLKAYQQLQERADYLQRLCAVTQTDLKAANAHLKFVVTDWNTLCLTLYRLLAMSIGSKVNDEWVARDVASGEEIARCKTMPEVFEVVLKLRFEEARKGVPDESLR